MNPPAAVQTSPLLELYEPFFQYLCRLNRAGRVAAGSGKSTGNTGFITAQSVAASRTASARGMHLSTSAVKAELKALLASLQQRAAGDFRLAEQVRKLELPVKFFADSYIADSRLPFAREWNDDRLAFEVNELAGDEKFFDIVEETLRDRSAEATERLAVLYVCLGLGFTGAFPNQPELLRKMMNDIAPRVQHLIDGDPLAPICPEAYQGVDSTNLVKPESNRVVIVGLLFVCFTVAALAAFILMYTDASRAVGGALKAVKLHDPRTVLK